MLGVSGAQERARQGINLSIKKMKRRGRVFFEKQKLAVEGDYRLLKASKRERHIKALSLQIWTNRPVVPLAPT
jgi:hypothetical protein